MSRLRSAWRQLGPAGRWYACAVAGGGGAALAGALLLPPAGTSLAGLLCTNGGAALVLVCGPLLFGEYVQHD